MEYSATVHSYCEEAASRIIYASMHERRCLSGPWMVRWDLRQNIERLLYPFNILEYAWGAGLGDVGDRSALKKRSDGKRHTLLEGSRCIVHIFGYQIEMAWRPA